LTVLIFSLKELIFPSLWWPTSIYLSLSLSVEIWILF
jgi:hypothetical protein